MTSTTYYVLPPERDWPGDVEACARALVDGAEGLRGAQAALSLLFRDPDQTIFRADVIDVYVDGIRPAYIRWSDLHRDADSRFLWLNPRPRALVMLACSMASARCAIRLGSVFPDLDGPTREAFTDAAAYLWGVTR